MKGEQSLREFYHLLQKYHNRNDPKKNDKNIQSVLSLSVDMLGFPRETQTQKHTFSLNASSLNELLLNGICSQTVSTGLFSFVHQSYELETRRFMRITSLVMPTIVIYAYD